MYAKAEKNWNETIFYTQLIHGLCKCCGFAEKVILVKENKFKTNNDTIFYYFLAKGFQEETNWMCWDKTAKKMWSIE